MKIFLLGNSADEENILKSNAQYTQNKSFFLLIKIANKNNKIKALK